MLAVNASPAVTVVHHCHLIDTRSTSATMLGCSHLLLSSNYFRLFQLCWMLSNSDTERINFGISLNDISIAKSINLRLGCRGTSDLTVKGIGCRWFQLNAIQRILPLQQGIALATYSKPAYTRRVPRSSGIKIIEHRT
jgi:hypothetical protein